MRAAPGAILASLAAALAASAAAPPVAITEWMYSGSSPAGGEFLELTNLSAKAIDLAGWSLDDSAGMPGAFPLDALGTIAPGESVVVTEDEAEAFRAAWALDASVRILGGLGTAAGNNLGRNDEINLFGPKARLVDRLAYGDQAFPGSVRTQRIAGLPASAAAIGANDPYLWKLAAIGDAEGSWSSAFGDLGNPGAYVPPDPAGSPLRVNEIMASNASTLADEDGDHPDWIELVNTGRATLDLAGHGLSDDPAQPFRWTLPAVSLEPGGFLLLFASGKDRAVPGSELHTNFSISAGGEPILLTAPSGAAADLVEAVPLPTDVSWGRFPDGEGPWWLHDAPTPGAANGADGYLSTQPVQFSHGAGFHPEAFTLALACEDADAEIRYTLDGSLPGPDATLYTGPIEIADRSAEADRFTTIPTAPPEGWNVPAGPVFKGTVVRAVATRPGARPSDPTTATFFVHPDGAARYPLPVVAVTASQEDLFGYTQGIYTPGFIYDVNFDPAVFWVWRSANYRQSGQAWERPGHLEFLETDGSLAMSQGVGLRIHGGATRAYCRKSLRLYARSEYGASRFEHAVFPGDAVDSFKRLILRNSGNDYHRTLFHDAMVQSLAEGTGLDTQASRPAIVFVNGEYWGVHNLRERQDQHYLASRHGVDPEAVDLLEGHAELEEGNASHYLVTYNFLMSQDPALPENLDWLASRMDLANHATYFAFQIYVHNVDWPQNNVRYWRPQTETGRWRWMLYDTDYSLVYTSSFVPADVAGADSLARIRSHGHQNAKVFQRLLLNADYRRDFINRYADLMNTALRPERFEQAIAEAQQRIAATLPEHIARWRMPASPAAWLAHAEPLRRFAQDRPAPARQHVVSGFGLPGTSTVSVLPPPAAKGRLRLSTLELPDAPWSGVYFQSVPVPIRGEAMPGHRFAGFEELDAEPDGEGLLWWTPDAPSATLTAIFLPSADLDGDGAVGGGDLAIVLSSWGACGSCAADLDGDGMVGGGDLAAILSRWGLPN